MPNPRHIYDLLQEVGRGAYGSVWRARHKSSRDIHAVKIIRVNRDADTSRLLAEARILESVRHDLCVGYFATYEHGDEIWIAMEYCEGGSVADLMRYCNTALTEAQIADVAASVLLGLEYLHSETDLDGEPKPVVSHRDVKAANLTLTPDGRVKLADFGVAAYMDTLQPRQRTITGAPHWMAPEVLEGRPYNHLCDIWSLGITIIELAQRRPPFWELNPQAAMFSIAEQQTPPSLATPSNWSDKMNDFIERCLVRDADSRNSASDLLTHEFVERRAQAIGRADNKSDRMAALVRTSMPAIERGREARDFDNDPDSSQISGTQVSVRTGAS